MNEPEEFLFQERQLLATRCSHAILLLAIPLVCGFILIDYIYVPDGMWSFAQYRFLVIPVGLIGLWLIRQNLEILAVLLVDLFLGIYTAFIIVETGGVDSHYWFGLHAAIIGNFAFLSFPPRTAAFIFPLIALPTIVSTLLTQREQLGIWAVQSAGLLCISFVSIITYILARKSRFSEFQAMKEVQHLSRQQNETMIRIAHDIRAPFVFLSSLMKRLERVKTLEELRNYLDLTSHHSKGLIESNSRMVNDLLDLGHESILDLRPHSLRTMVEEALFENFLALKDEVPFEYDLGHEHQVHCDYSKVKRILSNILQNAIKKTRSDMKNALISFKTKEEGE